MPVPAPGARRRARTSPPRDVVLRVKVSADEMRVLEAAAARASMSVGAWLADAALTVAEHHGAVPADQLLREILAEQIRLSGLVRRAGINLNQAVARLNATGAPGPDLAPAAAYITRVARHVDDASLAVSDQLTRWARGRRR